METESEQNEQAQTCPREILLQIFELLNLEDRRAVRQVCRKWFDACQDRRFQIKEKFTIEKLYLNELENVLDFFTKVDRVHFNFEFNGLNFMNDFPCFWETCGPRINSLEFKECDLSRETFSNIVTKCTKLRELTLRAQCDDAKALVIRERGNEEEPKKMDLKMFVENGHVNTSVELLSLHFHCLEGYHCSLNHLFKLFPRVNDLHLVTLSQHARQPLAWVVLAEESQLTKLTEIGVHVESNSSKDLLTSFLARLANLKMLYLRGVGSRIIDDSLDIILNNCHQLELLELSSNRRLHWKSTWFESLAKSSLAAFNINGTDIVFPNNEAEYPRNSNIRRFKLRLESAYDTSAIPFIKAFQFLEELTITPSTDSIMQAVLEHQKHLIILDTPYKAGRVLVGPLRSMEDFMFPRYVDYSRLPYWDLSKLSVERLSIPADAEKGDGFLSAPLKYLRLYPPSGKMRYSPLAMNTKKSPLLEEIIIEVSCFSFPLEGTLMESLSKFIGPLKKLRYLFITAQSTSELATPSSVDRPSLDDNFVKTVFESCPMLRCFIYNHIYFRSNLDRRHIIVADMDEKLPIASNYFIYHKLYFTRVDRVIEM